MQHNVQLSPDRLIRAGPPSQGPLPLVQFVMSFVNDVFAYSES